MMMVLSKLIQFISCSFFIFQFVVSFQLLDYRHRRSFTTKYIEATSRLEAYRDDLNGRNNAARNMNKIIGNVNKLSIHSPDNVLNNTINLLGRGRITMVGAGPGDPELLTIAALKVISDQDALVITDRLVSDEILALVKGEIRVAKKHPGCAEVAQEEIYRWVEEGLSLGKHVIRLKIGDPFVFGRGGEEVLRFRSIGYEPVVIPGVSATFAAPLLGGIPVTHRGVSNQVVMCTGYGRNGTNPDLIKYQKEQTVVFLMAVGRLRELSSNLCELAGYPLETPIGIIEKAGCRNEQRTLLGNLANIADLADKHKLKAPSTIVVGECVNVLLDNTIQGLVPNVNVVAGAEMAMSNTD